jgi:hypothetical protein
VRRSQPKIQQQAGNEHFTPIRWSEIEDLGGGVYLYRPKAEEFQTPRGVESFLRANYHILREAATLLAEHPRIRAADNMVSKFGFLLHPNDGSALLGLNVQRSRRSKEFGIFINPFVPGQMEGDEVLYGPGAGLYRTPSQAAVRLRRTIIHELLHLVLRAEGMQIESNVEELARTLGEESLRRVDRLLARLMGGSYANDRFSRQYLRLRDAYLQDVRQSTRTLRDSDLLRFGEAGSRPEAYHED